MDPKELEGVTATYAQLSLDTEDERWGANSTSAASEEEDKNSLAAYFGASNSAGAAYLERGLSVSDEAGGQRFREGALLGQILVDGDDGEGEGEATSAYLNTHEPFCFVAVGVQGAGKSHTLACALEACLVPFPQENIVRLDAPMTALVLHYDTSAASVCEATGLLSPAPALTRILGPAAACVPKERAVVLVSPAYLKQRRDFYGDYCTVKPLLLRWHLLSADHIKRIMRIKDGDNQLYVAALLDLLRRYQVVFFRF